LDVLSTDRAVDIKEMGDDNSSWNEAVRFPEAYCFESIKKRDIKKHLHPIVKISY